MCMHSTLEKKPVSKNKAQRELEIKVRLMTLVPATLPEAVDNWIEDVCLNNRHFIYYDKKSHYAYCTRCKTEIDKRLLTDRAASHNQGGRCPLCRHDVTYKCIGKYRSKKYGGYYGHQEPTIDRFDFQISIMQSTPEAILIRKFYMIRRCYKLDNKAKVELSFREELRIFNNGITPRRYARDWHDEWYETVRTSLGIPKYDFIENLNEIIAGTPFQYAKKCRDLDYYAAWIKPVEYLEKTGWTHLARNILYFNTRWLRPEATSIDKFLRLPKSAIKFAQSADLDIEELQALRIYLKEIGSLPKSVDIIKSFATNLYHFRAGRKICPAIKINQFEKFAYRNKGHMFLWSDYLKFCIELGYDMTAADVLYPKSIREAHNREMTRIKVAKDSILQDALCRKFDQDIKMAYSAAAFIIRPPKDLAELLKEGSELVHCVGGYANRIAKNETTILFIRKADHPEDPFYTLEYNHNQVVQCRGYENGKTTPEVDEFIRLWQIQLKKNSRKKPSKTAAAV